MKVKLKMFLACIVISLLCFSEYNRYNCHINKHYGDSGFVFFQDWCADSHAQTLLQGAAAVSEVGSHLGIVVVGNLGIATVVWKNEKWIQNTHKQNTRQPKYQTICPHLCCFLVLCFVFYSIWLQHEFWTTHVFSDEMFNPTNKGFMVIDKWADINFGIKFYFYTAFTASFRAQVRNLFTVCK